MCATIIIGDLMNKKNKNSSKIKFKKNRLIFTSVFITILTILVIIFLIISSKQNTINNEVNNVVEKIDQM